MTVYFIQAKNDEGLVKIGWCKGDDPSGRLKELQTGCPYELELLAWLRGAGRDVEAAYHLIFKAVRIRGEWFWPSLGLMTMAGYADRGKPWPDP